jgi:hypothetical protein
MAHGRFRRGTLNKTEGAYQQHLDLLQKAGEIVWYRFEAVTLKLGPDVRYTPDFLIMLPDGQLEAHEVKGGWFRDDAKAKVRIAARMFPLAFQIVRARSKKDGGGWEVEKI